MRLHSGLTCGVRGARHFTVSSMPRVSGRTAAALRARAIVLAVPAIAASSIFTGTETAWAAVRSAKIRVRLNRLGSATISLRRRMIALARASALADAMNGVIAR